MKKILIAERDSGTEAGESLSSFLKGEYEVSVAGSQDGVLACLREREYGLLIVDAETPIVKTLRVIEEAKRLRPELSVIVTYTYFDRMQDVELLIRRVADVCIRKPFDGYEAILKAIKKLEAPVGKAGSSS